jgi:transposase InsO family protein
VDAISLDPIHGTIGRGRSGILRREQWDSYDNAMAESIIGLFKSEVIHRRGPWRNLGQVEYAVLEWVDWFNHRRLLEPIDYTPPMECEAAFYRAQAVPA